MFKASIIIGIMFIVATSLNAALPVKARVPGGIGLLLVPRGETELVIYKEPKIGRVTEKTVKAFPALQFIHTDPQKIPVIVTSRKPGFYRVIFDDGEREGWIDSRISQVEFFRWQELLPGRTISLISGLRKEFYTLKNLPTPSAPVISQIEKGRPCAALSIDGDWMQVRTETNATGWFRWQDENGRLVISFSL